MKLYRLKLNVANPHTVMALQNPNLFHGAIEKAFDGKGSVLWRIDTLGGEYYLLILSAFQFEQQILTEQFGYLNEKFESVDYDKVLDRIQANTQWHFRLVANPTFSSKKEGKKEDRGKILACLNEESQIEWLTKRSHKLGFSVVPGSCSVIEKRWIRFTKRIEHRRVTLYAVTYEGYLKVLDPEIFKKTLVDGVGRGKAYGLGLLTIMKV